MSYQLGSVGSDQRAEAFDQPAEREARPRSRAALAAVVALIVMGIFAGGLWFAYVQGLRHANAGGSADVPLIRADERPTKVKPEKPGGMEIPDRDKLIYTQKRAAVEHLLPPPEKPMPRPTAPSAAAAAQPDAPQPPAAAASAPSIVLPAPPQQPAAKPAVKTPPSTAASAKPPIPQGSPAMAGGTRIQLGSVRSEEAARQEWDRIKRTNSDLLGSFSATPIRADLGEKGVYYRIQTGPIADADRVCGELKRRNIGCIITR
jgi:hypothetical protein